MQISSENLFINKDVHQQVRKLNNIVINAFFECRTKQDNRDPLCITEYIKTKI